MSRISLVVSILATGVNVSTKSILGCYAYPFTTNLDFWLFCLVLKIHLTPIAFFHGLETNSQVTFFLIISIYTSLEFLLSQVPFFLNILIICYISTDH